MTRFDAPIAPAQIVPGARAHMFNGDNATVVNVTSSGTVAYLRNGSGVTAPVESFATCVERLFVGGLA